MSPAIPMPRTLRRIMVGCALLAACADEPASTAVREPTTDDGQPTGGRDDDAADERDAARTDAESMDGGRIQADAGVADRADTGQRATPSRCGDVVAADHPAFEAIKKLATTDDEVRILVYGQSISEQDWWQKTKAWLERTYPRAKLVMEQHARGGCASQCLIGHEPWTFNDTQYNRLPEDVFAWKPDLVIFHVYGDHVDYGYVMEGLKRGCAAFDDYRTFDGKTVPEVRCTAEQRAMSEGYRAPEVLVQNDFVASDEPVACPAQPEPSDWDCFMNERVIPEEVAEHGYVLQDNFHEWPRYVKAHGIDPSTLLSDGVHLSQPVGTDVMFALTIPHLCYAP